MSNLLTGLNQNQIKAVEIVDRPLRVIAGAGSGKTRVLTTKIAYLIEEKHIPLSRILAVTFTNKAAKEMRERVENLTDKQTKGRSFICTFHSFCVRVLREDYEKAGLKKDFLIIDEEDKRKVIKDIIKELGLDYDEDHEKLKPNELNDLVKKAIKNIS